MVKQNTRTEHDREQNEVDDVRKIPVHWRLRWIDPLRFRFVQVRFWMAYRTC